MPKRRCIDCSTLTTGTRCAACTRAQDRERRARLGYGERYNAAWERHSRELRAQHLAEHGAWCPGWGIEPHEADDLVVDHDLGVMCRGCNSRKARLHDQPARQARPSAG